MTSRPRGVVFWRRFRNPFTGGSLWRRVGGGVGRRRRRRR
jgi:hypothetical protein